MPPSKDVENRQRFDEITQGIFFPSDKNVKNLDEVIDILDKQISLKIVTSENEEIELPENVCDILMSVLNGMSEGKAIQILPLDQKLTTTQAADFLDISRPTLVTLLEEGKIPYEKPRRHRQVYLSDLIAFKEKQRAIREEVLVNLTIQADRIGAYNYI